MSNCEKELQELMKQIDLNVVTKKREWEREREGLQSRLQVREKECLMQKSTLEQKHKEVSDFVQTLLLIDVYLLFVLYVVCDMLAVY